MAAIISLNPEQMEYERDEDSDGDCRLTLIVTDTDGLDHRLVLEKPALLELVDVFRVLQEQFPGDLGVH